MYPTRRRISKLPDSTVRPNSQASPSLAASRPVSIFMVVVLPQPLDPRKPKISPRAMVKLTLSTAVKSPNRIVRFSARIAISSGPPAGRGGMAMAW